MQEATPARSVHVIVVANEKGGSGKSTVALNIAIGLMKRGQRVATIDLDSRQRSLTHYIENRRAWAQRIARDLETPEHICIDENINYSTAQDGVATSKALIDAVEALADTHDFIVIDTPGHDSYLMRRAHSMADTLITPLNDSFVDLDVLGSFDADSFGVTGISHYSKTVEEARHQRLVSGHIATDWIVMRNRLSMLASRNKRLVIAGLQELAGRLGFRCIEGLGERVIFRELYLRGLTALDELDEIALGTRPTMSHVTARQELEILLDAMNLGLSMGGAQLVERKLDAA
jgi:chromosome partitioning protein